MNMSWIVYLWKQSVYIFYLFRGVGQLVTGRGKRYLTPEIDFVTQASNPLLQPQDASGAIRHLRSGYSPFEADARIAKLRSKFSAE
jgi:hypothetical protein